jgi:hypothetical protein
MRIAASPATGISLHGKELFTNSLAIYDKGTKRRKKQRGSLLLCFFVLNFWILACPGYDMTNEFI